jgi:hypothetical membrane protein
MLLNTVAESIYPDYSVRTDALSVLGGRGQPTTLLWDGQLFVSGVLAALGVFLLLSRGAVPQLAKHRLVKVVYLLPPAATIVVSLVPWNTVIAIHTLAAFTTFLFGGISAIYAFRFTSLLSGSSQRYWDWSRCCRFPSSFKAARTWVSGA